jgi:hypothetical protein
MKDIPVQCCRCRNQHMESERVKKPNKKLSTPGGIKASDLCCPRCGCASFYDMRPQVAWCWASGLIEVGDTAPSDAIQIASGPKARLGGRLSVLARHGQGASNGKLLVPGVPEAESQAAKGDALAAWLTWCAIRASRSHGGVVFAQAVS